MTAMRRRPSPARGSLGAPRVACPAGSLCGGLGGSGARGRTCRVRRPRSRTGAIRAVLAVHLG
eukprot:2400504-Alexandrium_andersonii.AAC.1